MLSDKLSKLLSGDDIKAIQKIVISIGHICVKETSSTELDMALNLIFSLCRSKVIQLLPHLLYDLLISSVTHVGLMFTLMFFCVLSPVSIFCSNFFFSFFAFYVVEKLDFGFWDALILIKKSLKFFFFSFSFWLKCPLMLIFFHYKLQRLKIVTFI